MFKFVCRIMRLVGFEPTSKNRLLLREIVLLEQENERLIKEMVELQDESGSLWDMLDEIKKSDIANHTANQMEMEGFLDKLKEAMTEQMLKDFKPIGEA